MHGRSFLRNGAGGEARTRYLHLGKVALYRMSYTRKWCLRSESNQRHEDFQSSALPTELQRQMETGGRSLSAARHPNRIYRRYNTIGFALCQGVIFLFPKNFPAARRGRSARLRRIGSVVVDNGQEQIDELFLCVSVHVDTAGVAANLKSGHIHVCVDPPFERRGTP